MYLTRSGKVPIKKNKDNEKIYLIYQYFVHRDSSRHKELQTCLKFNVKNLNIDKIYLLNEKIYTKEELGIEDDKIEQRNIQKRIKFKDVFEFVEKEQLKGYIITCNADIFFDNTVDNLRKSEFSNKKQILCQLRFDYTDKLLGKCKLFGPRADSQDSWIFHSNFSPIRQKSVFDFIFGKPGCDNKLIYLFNILGFKVFNQPYFVKTYHLQSSQERDYGDDMLPHPYMLISPYIQGRNLTHTELWGTVGWRLLNTHKLTIGNATKEFTRFMFKIDNISLREYLKKKIKNDETFLIPQTDKNGTILSSVCLILNNVTEGTFFGTGQILDKYKNNMQAKYFWNVMMQLLQQIPNSGLTTIHDLIQFALKYGEVFNIGELILGFSTWDQKYRELMDEKKHDFYKSFFGNFKNTKWLSSEVMNIFNLIHLEPWILELKGQNILIVSPHAKAIKIQIEKINLNDIYGVNIFENCQFAFVDYNGLCDTTIKNKIVDKIGEFDIALCDCGIYGPLISKYVYSIGKSAIDIGNVLPMYFGLWTGEMISRHRDILKIYLNKSWNKI